MQNRILRLDSTERIRQQLTGFQNKKINIVLHDGTVHFAVLIGLAGNEIFARNMRGQKLTLPIADIYEVIIDVIS